MNAAEDTFTCPNCGNDNSGGFCGRCGQQRIHAGDLSASQVWHHLLHEVFHVDGKIFNSLKLLFTRPGQLTLDFLEGRRARHVNPIRLFLLVSAAYFLFPHFDLERARANYMTAAKRGIAAFAAKKHVTITEAIASLEDRSAQRGRNVDQFLDETFNQTQVRLVLAYKSIVVIAYLSSGIWLSLLLRKRRRYVAEHMVMALHLASFIMIVSPVLIGLRSIHASRLVILSAEAMLFVAYPLMAMRRVYTEEKWTGLIFKGFVALIASVTLFMVAVITVVSVSVLPRLTWLYR